MKNWIKKKKRGFEEKALNVYKEFGVVFNETLDSNQV